MEENTESLEAQPILLNEIFPLTIEGLFFAARGKQILNNLDLLKDRFSILLFNFFHNTIITTSESSNK